MLPIAHSFPWKESLGATIRPLHHSLCADAARALVTHMLLKPYVFVGGTPGFDSIHGVEAIGPSYEQIMSIWAGEEILVAQIQGNRSRISR